MFECKWQINFNNFSQKQKIEAASYQIKNSLGEKRGQLQHTNVIYEISCPNEECVLLQNVSYIGLTSTTLI